MGWDFTYGASRKDIVKQVTTDWENETFTAKCLTHAARGNVLWSVWAFTNKSEIGSVRTVIHCDLLGKMDGDWGYKGMSESVGPCYYSCPLSYLEMAEETNADWRAEVRKYHANAGRKFQVGDVVALVGSRIPHVKIVSTKPLLGTYAGQRYRLPRKMLGELIDSANTSG